MNVLYVPRDGELNPSRLKLNKNRIISYFIVQALISQQINNHHTTNNIISYNNELNTFLIVPLNTNENSKAPLPFVYCFSSDVFIS